MPTPQSAIFAEGPRHHYALEYVVSHKASLAGVKAELVNAIAGGKACCHLTVAIGPTLWGQLSPEARPDGFASLEAIKGQGGHNMPATNADVMFWLQGDTIEAVFDGMQAVHRHMQTVAGLSLDQPGFTYKDSRDLIGFVDGSANPEGDGAVEAALVPAGQPFAGGAHVFGQKWVHDMAGFNALAIEDQEAIVGRTKQDSIELEGDAMPETSHVSRTDVKIDGVGQKIWRTSFPFGNARECGLYFLCFACHPSRVQVQLERMFGISGDGLHDHLIHHTKPVTGAYWFAPSIEDLDSLLAG